MPEIDKKIPRPRKSSFFIFEDKQDYLFIGMFFLMLALFLLSAVLID